MKKVLTIAGSDCSGGAGIQADIKTITVHKMYAMSAVTALTAQNTTGVYGVMEAKPEFLEKQLECIFTDIFPDAVKIGMVSSAELIKVIAAGLEKYRAKNVVLDPVMVSTSGSRLMEEDALGVLMSELIPKADLITPNIPEAEILWGGKIETKQDMRKAAAELSEKFDVGVLVKGGHLTDLDAADVLCGGGNIEWFETERIENKNTHGTGCTLSSAVACGLAEGRSISESVRKAKKYLSGALRAGLDLGKGSGPLDHMYVL